MGVPVTFGSDSHNVYVYDDRHIKAENLLKKVGFKEGELSEIKEEDFWF